MIYADTDFFLALMKKSDWLKKPATRLLKQYRGQIWTSPVILTELLLLAKRRQLDATRLLIDVLELAELRGGDAKVFLKAAKLLKEHEIHAFDAMHASFCGNDSKIISSDAVFDRLGLRRIPSCHRGLISRCCPDEHVDRQRERVNRRGRASQWHPGCHAGHQHCPRQQLHVPGKRRAERSFANFGK